MTICYLCKNHPSGSNYHVFTFEDKDGLFDIGTTDRDKQGLGIIVCTDCQQKIIKDELRRRVLG